MKKNLAISLLLGISLLATGCSKGSDYALAPEWEASQPTAKGPAPGSEATYFSVEESTPEVARRNAPTGTLGKTASEQRRGGERQRFTPGASADEGVVVESRMITREYLNEKESPNYSVQAARPKSVRKGAKGILPSYPSSGTSVTSTTSTTGASKPSEEQELTKFKVAFQQPISTFSADVDTASYSNMRRAILDGRILDASLVRVEEMVNYFNYDLPEPKADEPFSVTTELSSCPWAEESQILRVGVKTKSLDRGESPPQNLVFLLDVSGSMGGSDKLPLLKKSLRQLVDTLDDSDRVAIVVYAGASGVVLPSTRGDKKTEILESIERLNAGGSTNGQSGIQLAYSVAQENRTKNSVNRVILATDGDFNVGLSSNSELKSFIEEKRESGLFLSVLGFGRHGNDKLMETLADNGNGNYAYIDNLQEARKVLVKQAGATLITVAKDVKFQMVFNTEEVESYRLIGYKNRRLANRDFNDDTKDAGELGAGHEVTALYEIRRKGGIDKTLLERSGLASGAKLGTLKMRYKAPDSDESSLIEREVVHTSEDVSESSFGHQWAVGVAGYGMLLESDLTTEELPFDRLSELLAPTMANDPDAYQSEFYGLVKKAEEIMP